MAALSRLRTTTAYVVWWLCVLLALLLAGACLLVALKADPGSPWGWWLRAADAVTFGWFARPDAGVVWWGGRTRHRAAVGECGRGGAPDGRPRAVAGAASRLRRRAPRPRAWSFMSRQLAMRFHSSTTVTTLTLEVTHW
ncbi:hypothetical protein [Nocardioides daphniae]|uniref:Uncharacterized protein n=1 Tax=Nocardioides daphniae TaxID=402297 RepID=A0A4P7UC26_9ACTN|nr:hypothetical protein [Nocardioides daphniae]QCC77680.1 hypothetical protein E2C04_11750 [Nocardioides daphniae]